MPANNIHSARSDATFLHCQIARMLEWEFGKAEAKYIMWRVVFDGKKPKQPWWLVFGEEHLVFWGSTAAGLLSYVHLNENIDRIVDAFEKISVWEFETAEEVE